jgi:hypothetical protein
MTILDGKGDPAHRCDRRDGADITVNALHPATFMPTKVSPAPPGRTGTGRYFG